MAKGSTKRSVGFSVSPTLIFGLIFVATLLFGGVYFYKYNSLNTKYKELTLTTEERNKRTVDEVAKLMDLPKDENPVVFAVKDKEKLGSAAVTKQFFEKAKNDDVILAYEKGNVSIIYRPSEKRIIRTDNYNNFLAAANPIKVGIIATGAQQAEAETLVKNKVLNVDIVGKVDPKVGAASSYVADATGSNAKAAKDLADKLGITVGSLPEGEARPDGAALIVVIAPPAAPPTQ